MTTVDGRSQLGPKGQATRARLLAAAEEVFGETAYDQASISEITRRARVAQGTFYLYFSSKTQIYGELVRQIGHDLRRFTKEAISGLTDRMEIERKGFEAFFEFVRQHQTMYRIVRQAEFVDREAFADYYVSFAEGYAAGLKAAADDGQIRTLDPEVVAWCLAGMGDLVGVRWILLSDDERVPSKVVDTMIELIGHGLLPDSDSRRTRENIRDSDSPPSRIKK